MRDQIVPRNGAWLVTLAEGPRIFVGDPSAIGERISDLNTTPGADIRISLLPAGALLPRGVHVETFAPRKNRERSHEIGRPRGEKR